MSFREWWIINKIKFQIEKNMATDEGNSQNKIGHWTNNEIGVAVQSWFCVQVELMA